MDKAKKLVKRLLPQSALAAYERYRNRSELARLHRAYAGLTTAAVFEKVYREGAWGKSRERERFYSGRGSHNDRIAEIYVRAVSAFLAALPKKPSALDLGCGDFSIGAQIRSLCSRYIAADIVEELIRYDAEKFKGLDVDFRTLDLSKDELPRADVLFLRQVLQHLANAEIAALLPKLTGNYTYLILTEHLPGTNSFAPNLDKPAGPGTRLHLGSGVVLTSPPFNLRVKEAAELARVEDHDGAIVTTCYRL